MTVLLVVGVTVAVAAAGRSTWSPCGLSMLSTITPFGERGRRHRYAVTAAWFVLGALIGGLTLGGLASGLALLVGVLAPPATVVLGLAAALAAGGALVDADAFGSLLPVIRRQVDDRWLARYRPWVYGAGFGWQIGVGFATYLMTAGVVLLVCLAVLSGSPAVALALGGVFGLARGSTVYLTARCSDAGALRALHARLNRIGPAVRRGVAGMQGGAAVGLALAGAGVGAGAAGAVLAVGTAVLGAAVGMAIGSVRKAPAPAGAS